jgi:murein DD-endopeptidase MepM/ murein hydrolase activator NlpD
MRKLLRIPVAALIALLVLGMASPVAAESASSARRKRDAARARKAELASKINELKASDTELDHAVSAINTQVGIQQSRLDAARQALDVAISQQTAANRRLAESQAKVAAMRTAVINRAIDAYVRPHAEIQGTATAADIGEFSRRAAIIEQVTARDQDVLDQLRASQLDLARDRDTAARARDLANQRRDLELKSMSALEQAKHAKQRLQGALQDRINEYQHEAAQETALSGLIRTKESSDRASRGDGSSVSGRVSGAGLIWPVGGPVTSPFGYRWGRLHAGIDIGCGYGAPIHAAKSGTVIFSGQMSGYGNVVIVDHGGGFSTLYAHQSRIAASDGQQVAQGQVLGYSGSTGHSTGPHLHFETRVDGNPQNPRQYLP